MVTKICEAFVKNVKSPFCPSFDKLPAQNAQNEFKLLLNGREMKLPPCFKTSAIIVMQYIVLTEDQLIFVILPFSLLIAYQ